MLYVTSLEDPWVGYTQAALHWMMSLLRAGYTDFQWQPLGGRLMYWDLMPAWCRDLSTYRPSTPDTRKVALIHHLPSNIVMPMARFGEKANLGIAISETETIPRWLGVRMNQLSGLITSTGWNQQALARSGVTVPIHVVPHAFGDFWWRDGAGEELPVTPTRVRGPGDPFVFYYVGTANERKNPEGVLRAFLRAFPKQTEEVALALKLTVNVGTENLIEEIVRAETGSTSRIERGGDIWLWPERWGEAQIRWLHHEVGDCYVSLHRGEGWGYSLMQAAMLGKPVIYTDYSAPTDYLASAAGDVPIPFETTDCHMDVDYARVVVGKPLQWAEPNLDAAVEAMRQMAARAQQGQVSRDPEETARLRHDYCWETVGAALAKVVESYK